MRTLRLLLKQISAFDRKKGNEEITVLYRSFIKLTSVALIASVLKKPQIGPTIDVLVLHR